jgi:thiamine-phosphate pyrophosphorylase
MPTALQRRRRLERARLYLVADARIGDAALRAALSGGVDMVQLRDRSLGDDELVREARRFRGACDEHGALLWINDRPDLALAAGADGVHVGQDDMSVGQARETCGGQLLVGRSTHSAEQLEAAIAARADQLSVGPVWETPTKPGRPGAGLGYVRHAARRRPPVPWFAIGGIDAGNVGEVVAAGAGRIVVVRAITAAPDPRSAAAELSAALEGRSVGAAAQ